jgi:hypothetical protein
MAAVTPAPAYADAILDRFVHNAIASISPATACDGSDQNRFRRIDYRRRTRQKPTPSRTPQAGEINPEYWA